MEWYGSPYRRGRRPGELSQGCARPDPRRRRLLAAGRPPGPTSGGQGRGRRKAVVHRQRGDRWNKGRISG